MRRSHQIIMIADRDCPSPTMISVASMILLDLMLVIARIKQLGVFPIFLLLGHHE